MLAFCAKPKHCAVNTNRGLHCDSPAFTAPAETGCCAVPRLEKLGARIGPIAFTSKMAWQRLFMFWD